MNKLITFNQILNINQEIQGRLRLLSSVSNDNESILPEKIKELLEKHKDEISKF